MYEVPLEPVTWMEAALVSVTVRVSVCPDEMLLVLAVIETVGRAAAALVAKAEIATKVRKGTREGIVFTGACLEIGCTNCLGTHPVKSPELSFSFDAGEARMSWWGLRFQFLAILLLMAARSEGRALPIAES